ncbi:hypothetical protein JB92DRAFT_3123314 [Gautieria morchelliformis]|nr:hypothetical protein JB92DRAFT_3123314 [Gautieria morchelliformis]
MFTPDSYPRSYKSPPLVSKPRLLSKTSPLIRLPPKLGLMRRVGAAHKLKPSPSPTSPSKPRPVTSDLTSGFAPDLDPDFEHPSDVDDLVREVKEAKEWLRGAGFLISPEFLNAEMNVVQGPTASRGPSKEPEVVGDAAKESENSAPVVEPIAAQPESLQTSAIGPSVGTKRRPMFISSEDEGDDAPTPKKSRKERARSPTPEIVAVEPTPAHRRKEYVAKDDREPDVKERGSKGKGKGKAKDKGLATGSSSISSKGVLDTPEGTRTSTLAGEERMEELVDRSEDLM